MTSDVLLIIVILSALTLAFTCYLVSMMQVMSKDLIELSGSFEEYKDKERGWMDPQIEPTYEAYDPEQDERKKLKGEIDSQFSIS